MDDIILITLIFIGVALAVLIAGAAFVVWRVWRSDERRLARRIGKLPLGDKLALGGALFRDPRIPIAARIIAVVLIVYLASPLDLLPDFIPVIGFLDDVLIVTIGAGLLLRSIPRSLLEEHIQRFEDEQRDSRPRLQAPRAG